MSLIIWGLVGLLTGLLCYIALPILIGPKLPYDIRQLVAGLYWSQAMTAMMRGLLVRRLHGGYTVVATEYDAKHEAEKFGLGGETKHAEDVANLMRRLYRRPFGMVYEGFNPIIDPIHAEAGEFHSEHVANDHHIAYGKNDQRLFTGDLPIPGATRLVELAHVKSILPGSAKLHDTKQTREFIKISLEGFKERSTMEIVSIIMAYGVGMGLVIFADTQGVNMAQSMPIVIDLLGVLP